MNLSQEIQNLQEIRNLIIGENIVSDKGRNTIQNKLVSDCGNHIDMWFYDDDGVPIFESTLMSKFKDLGFDQSDHMLHYDFKITTVNEYSLRIDFKFLDNFEKERS